MSSPYAAPEPPTGGASARLLLPGCAAVALLALIGGVAFVVQGGPAYPREKRAAFDRLRAVGVDAVVAEARGLISQGRVSEPWPPGIASLGPLDVALHTTEPGRPGSVWIKLGGNSLVGSWGLYVLAEGEAWDPRHSRRFTPIADGLYLSDAPDAPEALCGEPLGWRE
ncbi:MAG: hypothetical protein R3F62_06585 [Planctomycetota bacterium]